MLTNRCSVTLGMAVVLTKLIYMDVDDILNVVAEALHMIFLDVTPTIFAGILV